MLCIRLQRGFFVEGLCKHSLGSGLSKSAESYVFSTTAKNINVLLTRYRHQRIISPSSRMSVLGKVGA